MFEDSTFESTGRIRTRSRRWMMVTLLFNASILLALILIPLIYPEALPRQWMSILIEAPRLPAAQPEPPKPIAERTRHDTSEMKDGHLLAPPKIPPNILAMARPEPPLQDNNMGVADLDQGGPNVNPAIFQGPGQAAIVHRVESGRVRLTSVIVEGLILRKTIPVYPPIAKVTRKEGTVVLQATISTSGLIENLRVLSGDQMLTQAALDAVSNWRYRPYLLNGKPVEVETTINVIFKLTQ